MKNFIRKLNNMSIKLPTNRRKLVIPNQLTNQKEREVIQMLHLEIHLIILSINDSVKILYKEGKMLRRVLLTKESHAI